MVHIIHHLTLIIENIFRVSLTWNWREAHISLRKESEKNWRCPCWEKGKFILIYEFNYGQNWQIWPSPLSLSLYSTFKAFIAFSADWLKNLNAIVLVECTVRSHFRALLGYSYLLCSRSEFSMIMRTAQNCSSISAQKSYKVTLGLTFVPKPN